MREATYEAVVREAKKLLAAISQARRAGLLSTDALVRLNDPATLLQRALIDYSQERYNEQRKAGGDA